jgi:hypothetical protein
MEEGDIILNTSLLEISNRLEYYEQQVLGNTQNKRNADDESKLVKKKELQVIDYKEYVADVTTLRKWYNCVYSIATTLTRKTKYVKAVCLIMSLFPSLYYIFLQGTDYGDKLTGFNSLTLDLLVNLLIPPLVSQMNIFEYSYLIPFVKYNSSLKLFNKLIFVITFIILANFFTTYVYFLFMTLSSSTLHQNNLLFFSNFFFIIIICRSIYSFLILSILYHTDDINISNALVNVYEFIQLLNSGLFGLKYNNLKYISIYYYLFNIILVKAQELYDYPLLPNGEYQYTIYGYSSDVSYHYYALLGFLFLPSVIYIIPKKSQIFLT